MMHALVSSRLIAAALLVSCHSSAGVVSSPPCPDRAGWRYERIELPPDFAPALPKGVEHIYFAPGMFDPDADGYWSYAFVLDLEQPIEADAVAPLLSSYYLGLTGAVSEETGQGARRAELALEPDGPLRRGELLIDDVFTTGQPLTLSIVVKHHGGEIVVSVHPRGTSRYAEILDAFTARPVGARCLRRGS